MAAEKSSVAVAYAQALLDLADERQVTAAVADDMKGIGEVLAQDKLFLQFLRDPAIGAADREGALERTLSGQVNGLTLNFVKVLGRRGGLGDLPAVAEAFEDLLDERYGKVEVDVTVAQKLGDAELAEVRDRIAAALKKEPVIHQYVDESIIGGIVIRVGDRVIDGSVKAQLDALRRKMLEATPK
jgi:F-type H+-transporting ATPase subunit delta